MDHAVPPGTPNERFCGIISRLQQEIRSLPADVCASRPALQKLVDEAAQIVTEQDSYLAEHSSPSLPIVQRMIDDGENVDWNSLHAEGQTQFRLIPEMSAGGYEAVVLCHFARMSKARTILEIGMFTGTTTISLASLSGVEKVVTLELEAYLETYNRPYFEEAGVASKIDVRIGDAMTSLSALAREGACFDMIFIDADKPNYKNYYAHVLDLNLLTKGGFLAVDNTTFKAAPWAPDVEKYPMGRDVHDFNRIVRDDVRVEEVVLPIRDGITLIMRKGE